MRRRFVCFAVAVAAVVTLTRSAAADLEAGIRAFDAGDFERAHAELAPLADAGSAEAQYRIARLLQEGDGVPADPAGAVAWLDKAMGQGHLLARVVLGDAYEEGHGVAQDARRAVELWYEAGRDGFPPAVYRRVRAEVWYLHIDTESFVEFILTEHRDDLDTEGKSEEALRAELEAYVLDQKATAVMWMILAAGLGDPVAERDLPQVMETLTSDEKAEAERRAERRQ